MSERGPNPKDLLGVKKAPLRLVPPALVIGASIGMAEGGLKYDPYNWRENKVLYSIYLEAIWRHLLALLDGQDIDPDTGVPHTFNIAADIAIILDAIYNDNIIDDRPLAGPAPKMMKLAAELLKMLVERSPTPERLMRSARLIQKEAKPE